MLNLIPVLAISFLFIPAGSAWAQKEQPCLVRFAVTENSALDRSGVWPDDAIKWWKKDGKKKFPELCEASREDADFVLAWTRERTTEEYSVLVRSGSVAPSAGPAPPDIAQTLGMRCDTEYLTGQVSCYYDYRPGSETWETRERQLVLSVIS